MTTRSDAVSPKVATGTATAAVTVVLAYIAGQVPFIADLPAEVQGALFTIVVAAATFVAGYIKKDPARV